MRPGYFEDLLESFQMSNCRSVGSPSLPHMPSQPDDDELLDVALLLLLLLLLSLSRRLLALSALPISLSVVCAVKGGLRSVATYFRTAHILRF